MYSTESTDFTLCRTLFNVFISVPIQLSVEQVSQKYTGYVGKKNHTWAFPVFKGG